MVSEFHQPLVKWAIIIFIITLLNFIDAKSVTTEERDCNFLLKRLKREAEANFIEDDDAFIENLIKTTLSKEKEKCMEKYHLLEAPRQAVQQDDAADAKELRREVAKLKDLVNVVKDQRYILRTLDNPNPNPPNHDLKYFKTADQSEEQMKASELERLRAEMKKIANQLESSKHGEKKLMAEEAYKVESTDRLKDKLNKQQNEINNLKHLLQGVLTEMNVSRRQVVSTTTASPPSPPRTKDDNMDQMLKELALLEKKLMDMQHSSDTSASKHKTSDIVGMKPSTAETASTDSNEFASRRSDDQMQKRSTPERAADEELDVLLSLLAPEKTTGSVDSLLKSLDADSDDELERKLLSLERQMKHKKKKQLEDRLKSLEQHLSHGSAQSKSDDTDADDNEQLKHLLVKIIKKKKLQSESKSLDDDDVLDQLKQLQKNIKSLSTDDDDALFDTLEEKNGSLDVTLEKLINAGGSLGGASHGRRKLTQAQIKALRRRIMAMKNGNADSGDFGGVGGEAELHSGGAESNFYSNGNAEGHSENYRPQWYITPGHTGHEFYDVGNDEFSHYNHGHGGGNGPSYGPNKYGNQFDNTEHFYGTPGMYVVPTNQFGTPVYSSPSFGNYPGYSSYPGTSTGYNGYSPSHSGNAGPYGKYVNGNPPYGSGYSGFAYASSPMGPGNGRPYSAASSSSRPSSLAYGHGASLSTGVLGPYQGTSHYKPLFPAIQETPGSSYNAHQDTGASGAPQSYQNPQSSIANGQASVADLKTQIYELQGVINKFNKPEYVQKPEDKAIVYSLNKQIDELKGVVNTLQEAPYEAAPLSKGIGVYQVPQVDIYETPAQPPNQPPQMVLPHPAPQLPTPPQLQPQQAAPARPAPESQPQGNYQVPPVAAGAAARSYNEHYRKRRGIDVHAAIHQNEDVINALGAWLGEWLSVKEEDHADAEAEESAPFNVGQQRESLNSMHSGVTNVLEDINAKIVDVRNQLDQRLFQQRMKQYQPNAAQRHPLAPSPRSNNVNLGYNNYVDYSNYDYGADTGKELKIKFKKDSKKSDFLDKILDKILNKVIDTLRRAFPKILEVIFGSFEFTKDYRDDYSNYANDGNNNKYDTQTYRQGGDVLIDTFRGMGLFGLMPMVVVKILSRLLYLVQYLQRYKFFKMFLIPGIVLLTVAGAIVFLVWWLQPNEENDYKQLSYEDSHSTYFDRQATPYKRYPEASPMRSANTVQIQPDVNRISENGGMPQTLYQGANRDLISGRNIPATVELHKQYK